MFVASLGRLRVANVPSRASGNNVDTSSLFVSVGLRGDAPDEIRWPPLPAGSQQAQLERWRDFLGRKATGWHELSTGLLEAHSFYLVLTAIVVFSEFATGERSLQRARS